MEAIFPANWFANSRHAGHPAYDHWSFCGRLAAQRGVIRVSEQRALLPTYTRMMLDSTNFVEITEGDVPRFVPGELQRLGTPAALKKVHKRLRNVENYENLMVEMALASWYRSQGYAVLWDERDTWPDLEVRHSTFDQLLLLIECKRVSSPSQERFEHLLSETDTQVGNAKRERGGAPQGVLVLDVSLDYTQELASIQPEVQAPTDPVRWAWEAFQNKVNTVDIVLLLWNTFAQIEEARQASYVFRRNVLGMSRTGLLESGGPQGHLYKGDEMQLALFGNLY